MTCDSAVRNTWLLGDSLAGRTFGLWRVIAQAERPADSTSKLRGTWWLCRCQCGTERILPRNYLINGSVKSCGCKVQNRKQADKSTAEGAPKPRRTKNVPKGLALNFEELAKTTTCACCGAIFERTSGNWAYKLSIGGHTKWYCTWRCLQRARKK